MILNNCHAKFCKTPMNHAKPTIIPELETDIIVGIFDQINT